MKIKIKTSELGAEALADLWDLIEAGIPVEIEIELEDIESRNYQPYVWAALDHLMERKSKNRHPAISTLKGADFCNKAVEP